MCCESNCGCIEAIFSILFGAAVAALYFFGLLPFIIIFVWIAFALASIALLVLPLAATSKCFVGMPCVCNYGKCILIGAAGTFLTAIAIFVIALGARLLAPAIVIFIFASFFFFLILSIVFFIACLLQLACCK